MPLDRTPIEVDKLGDAARKALGAGPMKMMAARGLAPLARPGDLITVLYQLTLDDDAKIKEAAIKSASELPDRVLTPALQDNQVDVRVLDYFSTLVRDRAILVELIITNNATADQTIADLAGKLGESEVDLIASNEQRLLRFPAIIGAMYMNRSARMSTVDRAVELAVRNEIKVPGVPAWEEVARAILSVSSDTRATDVEVDALFAAAAKKGIPLGPEEEPAEGEQEQEQKQAEEIPIAKMTIPMKIRLATLGNSFVRGELVRDGNKMVSLAAIKAPGVTELEAIKYAGNSALSDEVIAHIARKREWTKMYGCKLALVNNPKTPMPIAMRLVAHLRDKDIRALARSKGIPSAVAATARKLVSARASGGGRR